MKRDYISLHNHSEYSNVKIIDSINRVERMIDYAWDLNLSGLAMTEHDCLSGTLRTLDKYRAKLKEEWSKLHPDEEFPSYQEMSDELDFKVILGNEIYLSEEGLTEQTNDQWTKEGNPGHFYHLILLAKDAEGYEQLKRLSSSAWRRAWFRNILRTPTYPSDLYREVKGGHMICSTACLGGYVARTVGHILELDQCDNMNEFDQMFVDTRHNKQYYLDKLNNHLRGMEELFGKGNFFIELQPNDEEYGQEQIAFNKYMIEHYWGQYPFIFTTDSHYLKEDEREIHKAFLNSKSSNDREVDDFYHKAYMMSQAEVRSLMPYVSDEQFNAMVENTRRIKDMCQFYELEQKPKLATVEYEHWDEYEEDLFIFHEVDKETYPNFYDYLHSENKADNYLARLVAHGYVNKMQEDWDESVYFKRLEEEFWTLREVGNKIEQSMANYFITMSKIIDICWDQAGTIVGPSRGSAGAFFINYLLGITQMNPIEMDLPFVWRFLHPSRPDLPDIDFDTESDKRAKVFNEVRDYFRSIGGDVVNVCTFGTEGTKSAIKTAGRGLNIEDEVISYVTSMIPNERGFDWSLSDCYYGNGDDRKPIKAFVAEMDKYPRLWELAQTIEGLITRLGVHASGVVCVNDDFNKYNSYMKTSKEQIVTSYDLHTLERCGMVKYDFLTVSALDRIHQALNYMLEDGTMEWQGTLRDTYNKYLHPEVLDYTNEKMWDMVGNGEISSLFQFDTLVGSQAIKDIQPRSVEELAISSSLMRLMSDGELPLAKYARYKRVPQLWYDEMNSAGLTLDEQHTLEKYLKKKCGVGESQEVIMQIVMDPHISNFDMKEANKLRKTIAKKQFREIEKVKTLFYEKGFECGSSKNLLDYIWNIQVSAQLGYSFSEVHTTAYALIALQEMNIAARYPIIYWNTACLSVDASAINAQDFYNLVDDDILEIDEIEGKRVQNKMDYAKIASALDKFKHISNIELPDINKSRLSFTPNVERNSILYGLKGISKVTEPSINEIMMNRPFKSFDDFLKRVTKRVLTKDKVINLIKCGAFNQIEGKSTKEILENFIWTTCEPKGKLTMQNANMLIEHNLFPEDLKYNCEVYKLTKELRKHRDSNRLWYIGSETIIPEEKAAEWVQIIQDSKIDVQELMVDDRDCKVIDSKRWDSFYEMKMVPMKNFIKNNHNDLLKALNQDLFNNEFEKYASGTEADWELDSMNFYFNEHPLKKVLNQLPVQVDPVWTIVEGRSDGFFFIKGKEIPKMHLFTIAGTVIDRDSTKGLVTVQTPDGVVTVKCYKDLYALYAQDKVEFDKYGNKIVLEESFFEKGVHLLITGIQRGATFVPKVYKNTGRRAIERIMLDEEGNFKELVQKGE